MMRLRVSDNKRFLVYEDGTPFFYLGDTAWELFHRLNREQADHYLETRARQRFTVIQAVVLAEHEFDSPTPMAIIRSSIMTRCSLWKRIFEHVDYIVDKAASLGLWTGMLPTWGDKWNQKWGAGPEIFTPDNAFAWGEFLGRRYKDKPILWILGGDRPVENSENDTHAEIIRSMAAGLTAGDGGTHLRTFHPQGQQTSSQYFHAEDWLDFNMYQTGHTRNRDCYNLHRARLCAYPHQAVHGRRTRLRGPPQRLQGRKRLSGRLRCAQSRVLGSVRGRVRAYVRLPRHLAVSGRGGFQADILGPHRLADGARISRSQSGAVRPSTAGKPPVPVPHS